MLTKSCSGFHVRFLIDYRLAKDLSALFLFHLEGRKKNRGFSGKPTQFLSIMEHLSLAEVRDFLRMKALFGRWSYYLQLGLTFMIFVCSLFPCKPSKIATILRMRVMLDSQACSALLRELKRSWIKLAFSQKTFFSFAYSLFTDLTHNPFDQIRMLRCMALLTEWSCCHICPLGIILRVYIFQVLWFRLLKPFGLGWFHLSKCIKELESRLREQGVNMTRRKWKSDWDFPLKANHLLSCPS